MAHRESPLECSSAFPLRAVWSCLGSYAQSKGGWVAVGTVTSCAELNDSRILVVAHDQQLQFSRFALLRSAGYAVDTVATDDDAIALIKNE